MLLKYGYGQRSDNVPQSTLWQPGALSNPTVPYPTPIGANTGSNPRPMNNRRAAAAAPQPTPEQAFKVNTGDWNPTPMGWNAPGPLDPSLYKTTNVPVGGGGGGGANDLLGQFRQQMNRANQANEARYQDILGGYQQRYQRGMGLLTGLGQQESRDINELYDSQGAKINQDLIGRGLGNSTVTSTMAMGNNRERNADLGRLNDRVRQQALSTDAGLSGDELQFMERRNDTQPDMGMLAQLAQALGAGGGGGGFGGGGGGGAPLMLGGYQMPFFAGGGGYQSPNAGWNANRKANARANYASKNAAANFDEDYLNSLGTPKVRDWSSFYDDARLRNAMAASGAGNAASNPYTSGAVPMPDGYDSSYLAAGGGMF